MTSNTPAPKDYLWLNLRELPYFRSLMRAYEASFYQDIPLPEPVLDLGSGDGQFATVAFDKQLTVGLDPWAAPMKEAARRSGYQMLVLGDGAQMPFPSGHFASAVSNSVLEHIPPIDAVLKETARVLQPGAPFVFCGPNHRFLSSLAVGNFLDRIGLRGLGDAYRAFFNRISRHYNSDSPQAWSARLEKAGFRVEKYWTYYPPAALHVTEWGHYLGLPSLVTHWLTGRWIIAPTRWNLALTEWYTRRFFDPQPDPDGVCTFFIARRVD
ncbi:MAG: class I SAM-dependent methyltransferase [Chloroflexota bacterium]